MHPAVQLFAPVLAPDVVREVKHVPSLEADSTQDAGEGVGELAAPALSANSLGQQRSAVVEAREPELFLAEFAPVDLQRAKRSDERSEPCVLVRVLLLLRVSLVPPHLDSTSLASNLDLSRRTDNSHALDVRPAPIALRALRLVPLEKAKLEPTH